MLLSHSHCCVSLTMLSLRRGWWRDGRLHMSPVTVAVQQDTPARWLSAVLRSETSGRGAHEACSTAESRRGSRVRVGRQALGGGVYALAASGIIFRTAGSAAAARPHARACLWG